MALATPAAAPPTRSEIERKLSLRSVSPPSKDPPRKPIRRTSGSGPSQIPAPSPALPQTTTPVPIGGGYDSDSSYTSSVQQPPVFPAGGPAQSSTSGSHGSPILSAAPQGGLSAIAERDGMLSEGGMSEEDFLEGEEVEEDDERSEDEAQIVEGGQLKRGVEGERVVKSGYLLKKGERRKNWQKRWFVLRTEKMAYYKDDREYVLCRILDLREIHTCASVQLKKHSFGFGIVTPKRTYYVQANSQADMDSWILAINEVRRSLAEADERARNPPPPVTQQPSPHPHQHQQKSSSIQIPKSGYPPGATATGSPGVGFSAASQSTSPSSRSIGPAIGSFSATSPSNLDGQMSKLALQSSPSPPASGERTRNASFRGTSARREPSTSSMSSAGGGGAGMAGTLSPDPGMAAAVTSSDEEEVYGPETTITSPGGATAGPSRAVQFQPIQTDPKKVILSGYLMKMGNKRKIWRKRWFVLTSGMLVYTKSHMDQKVHRQIPLAMVLDAIEVDTLHEGEDSDSDRGHRDPSRPQAPRNRLGRSQSTSQANHSYNSHSNKDAEHTFQVITPKRNFKLCAPSEEDMIKWLAALRTLVTRERGINTPALGSGPSHMIGNPAAHALPLVPIIHEQPPSPAGPTISNSMSPGRLAGSTISPGSTFTTSSPLVYGEPSYFPPQISGSANPTPSVAATTSTTTITPSSYPAEPRALGSPITPAQSNLPSLITAHRTRSATQTAKSAVGDAVRKLHFMQPTPASATSTPSS